MKRIIDFDKLSKSELNEMLSSEFFNKDELAFFEDSLIPETIEDLRSEFGFNDGEPLDEDGILFFVKLLTYRLLEAHGIEVKD